jgi:glycosyltransferase involved in cell wall biosynthesis
LTIILLIILLLAFAGTLLYCNRLSRFAQRSPQLGLSPLQPIAGESAPSEPAASESETLVSVIIPAYNEAENIRECVLAVLKGSDWPTDRLEVWVVDDQSTDETLAIAQRLQTELADPRLRVVAGSPRPDGEVWVGKNWACAQIVEQVGGELLLFLDADVRLQPGAIAAAVTTMQQEKNDLLTLLPAIVCGCFAEWLAQPLIMGAIAASMDFAEVNDPKSDKVFAVGQFMLFRRTAYHQIGGHRAVADQVVEDVELARLIKQNGLKLNYTLGHQVASVQMYQTNRALWEGWTKNWYLGSRCDLPLTLYGASVMFSVLAMPLLAFVGLAIKGSLVGLTGLEIGAIAVSFLTLLLDYNLRQQIQRLSAIPPNYWWLSGVGGLFVTAIILASIIKTETGWGWTWRGRQLAKPERQLSAN